MQKSQQKCKSAPASDMHVGALLVVLLIFKDFTGSTRLGCKPISDRGLVDGFNYKAPCSLCCPSWTLGQAAAYKAFIEKLSAHFLEVGI